MQAFTELEGVAAHLDLVNVDTDMIIPKQYLKTIVRTGLGKGLFSNFRYDDDGQLIESFSLNRVPFNKSRILISGANFGCGSSREHAVWALMDFGIRCVIAPSFGDIFYNNCFKNGILPLILDQERVSWLMTLAKGGEFKVDLRSQEVTVPSGDVISFDIDAGRRHLLLEGLDDIASTLKREKSITAYEKAIERDRPWI